MKQDFLAMGKHQSGVLLIEALIAILIFSIGVIALMGVQAASVRTTSDAKIRMDAEFFADQLLSEMIVNARDGTGQINPAQLQTTYGSAAAGAGFIRWRDRVNNLDRGGLPGAQNPATAPVVAVTQLAPNVAGVAITVFWRAPNDLPSAPPRRLVTTSVIRE
jgi:type IV pilus assembly protein PilV